MIDDLVKRLLQQADSEYIHALFEEAVDRIEALEAALRVIAKARENRPDNCSDEYLVWCCIDAARAALEGKKKT